MTTTAKALRSLSVVIPAAFAAFWLSSQSSARADLSESVTDKAVAEKCPNSRTGRRVASVPLGTPQSLRPVVRWW